MANREQLAMLRSGADEWNLWREKNPQVAINLQGAKLLRANLRDVNLEGADLRKTLLQYAHLQQANLAGANLLEADLHGANLRDANLQAASLQRANLQEVRLQGATLLRANFQDTKLQYAKLRKANLQKANLEGTNLEEADLQEANLLGSRLWKANLLRASLQQANLQGTDFHRANLQQTIFLEANFVRAVFGATVFAMTYSLAQAKGLESCRHQGPSFVDRTTLEAAQGQLPRRFLKGCGFKDWEVLQAQLHDSNLRSDEVIDITYEVANLRTKGPIQVSSLFISYARKDSAFVDFLERQLDQDGIRSWRDVHHMTAGPVEQQIERAIDLNGTMLLVLSENSLGSRWVEWEVEKADERQREFQTQGKEKHVLCPIAIDGSWRQSNWSAPLMNQIKKYNILDFSSWENGAEASYQKLKAGIAKYYAN